MEKIISLAVALAVTIICTLFEKEAEKWQTNQTRRMM